MIVAGIGSGGWPRALTALRTAGFQGETILVSAAEASAAGEGLRLRRLSPKPGASPQQLRAQGLAAARAERVASLSEDYEADAAWLAAAGAVTADVSSGPVLSADGAGWAERAAWMWEYAHLPPGRTGGALTADEAAWIPAGNVVYRRDAVPLDELSAASEIEAHRALAAQGRSFEHAPRLMVRYRAPSLRRFLRDRRRWSAQWAAGVGRRGLAGALLAVALPAALLARQAAWWLRRPGWRLRFLAALPAFALFCGAQTLGELDAVVGVRRAP